LIVSTDNRAKDIKKLFEESNAIIDPQALAVLDPQCWLPPFLVSAALRMECSAVDQVRPRKNNQSFTQVVQHVNKKHFAILRADAKTKVYQVYDPRGLITEEDFDKNRYLQDWQGEFLRPYTTSDGWSCSLQAIHIANSLRKQIDIKAPDNKKVTKNLTFLFFL